MTAFTDTSGFLVRFDGLEAEISDRAFDRRGMWGRARGLLSLSKMTEDAPDHGGLRDEPHDAHVAAAARTHEGVDLVHAADHLRPSAPEGRARGSTNESSKHRCDSELIVCDELQRVDGSAGLVDGGRFDEPVPPSA